MLVMVSVAEKGVLELEHLVTQVHREKKSKYKLDLIQFIKLLMIKKQYIKLHRNVKSYATSYPYGMLQFRIYYEYRSALMLCCQAQCISAGYIPLWCMV